MIITIIRLSTSPHTATLGHQSFSFPSVILHCCYSLGDGCTAQIIELGIFVTIGGFECFSMTLMLPHENHLTGILRHTRNWVLPLAIELAY